MLSWNYSSCKRVLSLFNCLLENIVEKKQNFMNKMVSSGTYHEFSALSIGIGNLRCLHGTIVVSEGYYHYSSDYYKIFLERSEIQ